MAKQGELSGWTYIISFWVFCGIVPAPAAIVISLDVVGRAMAQAVRRLFFLSPISGLIPKLDCLGFVVDKVTLRNEFMSVLRSSAVHIIPSVLPEHSCIC
jgi:hypothetical protein